MVTATAAIDSGRYTPLSVVSGKSPKIIDGVPLSNFGGEQFGPITLTQALTNSVNTVWAEVGVKLGKSTLFKYMDRYGFNQKPRVDLPASEKRASGVYDNGKLLDSSDAIDLGRVAIGQERLQVTPLQMAMVASAVANGGSLMRPRIATKVRDPDGRTVTQLRAQRGEPRDEEEHRGCACGDDEPCCGGGDRHRGGAAGHRRRGKDGDRGEGRGNQAWFIGFAPVRDPQVAVAVTVEQTTGQGGTVAAPIAKRVMESVL